MRRREVIPDKIHTAFDGNTLPMNGITRLYAYDAPGSPLRAQMREPFPGYLDRDVHVRVKGKLITNVLSLNPTCRAYGVRSAYCCPPTERSNNLCKIVDQFSVDITDCYTTVFLIHIPI